MSVTELAGVLRSADKKGNKTVLYPMTKIDLVDGLRDELNSLEVSKTANGRVLEIDNSAELPLLGLSVYGKSTQNATTGAQLWEHQIETEHTLNGVTYTYENGVYTLNGTPDRSFNFVLGTVSLEDGSYTLSANNPSHNGNSEQALIQVYSMTTLRSLACLDNAIDSFGTQEMVAGVDYELRMRIDANVTYNNFIVKPMLNKGASVLPWEPYTGGIPSPNPDFTQEIVSVGDAGSVDVSVYDSNVLNADGEYNKQTLTISTPNGLPGIQVTDASVANYTDSDGNMWCCDEVDFGRGVYVKRINELKLDGSGNETINLYANREKVYGFLIRKEGMQKVAHNAFCTHFKNILSGISVANEECFLCGAGSAQMYIMIHKERLTEYSVPAFNNWLSTNPLRVLYQLATPIETPLSDDELTAYKALRTNCPNTTVMNDKNADMSMSYYSKRYNEAIDFIINKIEDNRDEIRAMKDIVEVTLLASNWSGSTAPYTQTVSAPGITEDDNPTLVTTMYDGIGSEAKAAYLNAFGVVATGSGTTNNGSVTFSVSEKPTIDIVVGLKGV